MAHDLNGKMSRTHLNPSGSFVVLLCIYFVLPAASSSQLVLIGDVGLLFITGNPP